MSNEVFTGRCIGGPLDGLMRTNHAPFVRVAISSQMCWEPASTAEISPRVEIVTYRYWSSKYVPDGLWLAE